jgi:ring-1,2-phenylacetyl-CoA epoxidase subunit PaaC
MDHSARRRHGREPQACTSCHRSSLGLLDEAERGLIEQGIAIDPAGLRPLWVKTIAGVIADSTLSLPTNDWMQQGGRSGRHSEHLGHLLSELQYMQRTFPGLTW